MNTSASQHISLILNFLNEQADYAVLRNYEDLPDSNKSRDIDIIITRQSLRKIKGRFLQMIEENGWKTVTYLNSDRLITYVLSVGGLEEVELVQWDFFINTSVWGIQLMSAEEFLQARQFNGKLYYVDIGCQFLDKYLYNRAVGSAYPEKYASTRAAAEDMPMVKQKLKDIFGINSTQEGDSIKGSRLLWRSIKWNLKHRPMKTVADVARFIYTFTANYFTGTGFSIGFTGPDGSGKTTVIETMIEQLGPVFRKAHVYYHFRPTLFGNISDVAHSAGLKKEVDKNYDQPHRGGKTGKVSSLLRLLYYTIDYILGHFIKVKRTTRITRLAIFDRYYTDIICDSRRSRIYLSKDFLYTFGRLFIPQLDYNILLTASTDTIMSRKGELDKEGIEAINAKIDFLTSKKGFLKVTNDNKPEDAVRKILEHVFKRQHEKNRKRTEYNN